MLHQKLIDAADAHDQQARKAALVIPQLEAELRDVRFLNEQYQQRIAAEQRKLDEERRRIDDTLRKWHVWANRAGTGAHAGNAQAQHVELRGDGVVLPMREDAVRRGPPLVQPHVADVVKLAEKQAEQERQRANDAEVRTHHLEVEAADLRAQLRTREEEIYRLGALLEAERAPERKSRVDHLEQQIVFLEQTINELEVVRRSWAFPHMSPTRHLANQSRHDASSALTRTSGRTMPSCPKHGKKTAPCSPTWASCSCRWPRCAT